MALRSQENSFGAWAFLVGVILAVIIGISTSSFFSLSSIPKYSPYIYGILVLIGLIVGFSIQISGRDSSLFLIASAVLVIVSSFGKESVTGSLIGIGLGDVVASTFSALLALFVPATIIVALKTVFSLAKV